MLIIWLVIIFWKRRDQMYLLIKVPRYINGV